MGCLDGEKRPCGPETVAGMCQLGARTCAGGVWGDCQGAVAPAVRQCASELDNDCNGQPDNVVDAVCRCLPGSAEPCDAHPGLDGVGRCRAGQRECVLASDGLSSDWGACVGAVGPGTSDSCSVRGDDANCDGTPNGGCACVDGDVQACGFNDLGICQMGTSTCVDSRFGECVDAILPGARDCSSAEDNDCDGEPDDTIDSVCTCTVDAVEPCNTHPGLDGKGVCRAGQRRCEAGEDNETSTFGACTGGVGPALRNCTLAVDNDCNGLPDNTIDSVCLCAIGSQRACEQHPGLDGNGLCRAGTQLCIVGANNTGSQYSACLGATGPTGPDSCLVPGNDANCDGVLNGGCECIAGVGCSSPAAARCEASGVCAACAVDSDCAAIAGRGICDAGLCVQCTPTARAACAATEVCDASSRSCTAPPVVTPPVVTPPVVTPPIVVPPVVVPPVVVAP